MATPTVAKVVVEGYGERRDALFAAALFGSSRHLVADDIVEVAETFERYLRGWPPVSTGPTIRRVSFLLEGADGQRIDFEVLLPTTLDTRDYMVDIIGPESTGYCSYMPMMTKYDDRIQMSFVLPWADGLGREEIIKMPPAPGTKVIVVW